MDWTEHALHPLVNTAPWSKDPASPEGTRLDWVIREVNETLDNVPYAGFSYGFRYQAPEHPVYQIEDKATWELGGNIVGNGFIMRGGNAPHTRFKQDTVLYSGWYFPGIANPHVFQHKPLYTQMQGFTFQYDSDHVLVTVHEHPSHVRALYQRASNEPTLLHFNQFCFDLTTKVDTPPRKILVGPRKKKTETGTGQSLFRLRDFLQEQHRQFYGLRYDRARATAHVETWAIVKMDSFQPIFEQLRRLGREPNLYYAAVAKHGNRHQPSFQRRSQAVRGFRQHVHHARTGNCGRLWRVGWLSKADGPGEIPQP